ncbi:hypothetical protein ABZ687_13155 [Streptomyces ardesiacus]
MQLAGPHQEPQPPADRDISTDQVVTLDTTVYEQEPDAMPCAADDEEIDL